MAPPSPPPSPPPEEPYSPVASSPEECSPVASPKGNSSTDDVPNYVEVYDEPLHPTVLENDYVKVMKVDCPAETDTMYHRHAQHSFFLFFKHAQVRCLGVRACLLFVHIYVRLVLFRERMMDWKSTHSFSREIGSLSRGLDFSFARFRPCVPPWQGSRHMCLSIVGLLTVDRSAGKRETNVMLGYELFVSHHMVYTNFCGSIRTRFLESKLCLRFERLCPSFGSNSKMRS